MDIQHFSAIRRTITGSLTLIFLVLTGLALTSGWAQAQDNPNAIDVTGSITGTVTNEAGAPLASIEVTAYRSGPVESSATTDAAGNYQLAFLRTGNYKVEFSHPVNAYLSEYYSDAADPTRPKEIAVAGNQITGINIALAASSGIAGSLTFSDTLRPNSVDVSVLKRNGSSWSTVTERTFTLTTGTPQPYQLFGLPSGMYAVKFDWYAEGRDWALYYPGVPNIENATPVTVTGGAVTPNIDWHPETESAFFTIDGAVTNDTGTPLPNIAVTAYLSQTEAGQPLWKEQKTVKTDGAGVYRTSFTVDGVYALSFRDGFQDYITQFYQNAQTLTQTTSIALSAAAPTAIANATMQRSGSISGRILQVPATPSSELNLRLKLYADTDNFQAVVATQDLRGGNPLRYAIKGLAAGTYRLLVQGIQTEYYPDALEITQAGDIVVNAGLETPDINLVLGQNSAYATLAGQVSGVDGEPLPNISVTLDRKIGSSWSTERRVTTSHTGAFFVQQVPPETYRICFSDANHTYVDECYADATAEQPTLIIVQPAAQITNLNAGLAKAGAIHGRVDRFDHTTNSLTIILHRHDGFGWSRVKSQQITGSGSGLSYAVNGLYSGVYRVELYWYANGDHELYYPNTTDIESAQDIAVTSGEVTPEINFVLGQDQNNAHIAGAVTSDGAPQAGIQVDLFYSRLENESWQRLVYVFTDTTGAYSINGLGEGKYRLYFSDPSGKVAPIYFGQADQEQDAAIVRLGTTTQAAGVNVDMAVLGNQRMHLLYLPVVTR